MFIFCSQYINLILKVVFEKKKYDMRRAFRFFLSSLICIDCAGVHRQLGVGVSKVRVSVMCMFFFWFNHYQQHTIKQNNNRCARSIWINGHRRQCNFYCPQATTAVSFCFVLFCIVCFCVLFLFCLGWFFFHLRCNDPLMTHTHTRHTNNE